MGRKKSEQLYNPDYTTKISGRVPSLPWPLLLNNTSQGPKKRISRCHGPSSWDEKFSSLHVVNLSVGNAISKRVSKRWSTCAVNQSGMFFLTNMF